jgi:branched-chain amino acid transport system permease protein
VLAPVVTNNIDSSLTAVLQGVILLVILFVLPGGLVSLPRLWRRRKNDDRGMPAGGAAASRAGVATVSPTPADATSAPTPPPSTQSPPTQSQEKRQEP